VLFLNFKPLEFYGFLIEVANKELPEVRLRIEIQKVSRLVRSSYGISQLGRGGRYEDGPCYLVGLERREQLEEINCYRKKTHKKLHD